MSFIQKLQEIKNKPLPGLEAHLEMTPYRNVYQPGVPPDARKSAVLMIINEDEGIPKILLIRRPTYDGVHSGQVAFPGGRFEETDSGLLQTALRETTEEIGIHIPSENVMMEMSSLYISPSKSLVFPFVAFTGNATLDLIPDKREVDYAFYLPLNELEKEQAIHSREIRISEGRIIHDTPCFIYNNEIIWGATAAILNEFRWLLRSI